MSNTFTNLPGPVKAGAAVVGGGGFLWGVEALMGWRGLLFVVLGLMVVGLLLLAYLFLLKRQQKKRAERLGREIKQGFAGTPHGVTQAELIARLDDLRGKFDQGLETFRAAGKNIYNLPWYVMAGEPGCGKTEAIRNCNVGFPPGLHDELQGVGGTINMNWWFTNYAVILDTAGRLMFEDVDTAKSTEWKEFLKLLKDKRPDCPINGMMLVISADSLIRDTAESIEKKGAKIAQQFDIIQRSLDIRFPVFVLITKCDLINGFREFFDDLKDPQLQHQILGWSNPAPIDQPFQPDKVSQHLDSVNQRLMERRLILLQHPGSLRETSGRAFDTMDTLYDFPSSFSRIVPRLKRYLQIIFAASEWSTKPLFLRGIYFTSSMREGSALDADLAEALGVPIESLPEGRVWEKDRAYFLRDTWMEKVFKEKGLVTRSSNARFMLWRRKAALLAAGFCSVLLLFLLTWLGGRSLKEHIGGERDFWAAASGSGWMSEKDTSYWMPMVYPDVNGQPVYGGLTSLTVGRQAMTVDAFHGQLLARVGQPLRIPFIFMINDQITRFVEDEKSIKELRRESERVLFESSVLHPLLDGVRGKMIRETQESWSPEAQAALEQLIRIEAYAADPSTLEDAIPGGSEGASMLDLDALFRYVLGASSTGYRDFKENGRDFFATGLLWLYGDEKSLLKNLSGGADLSKNEAIRKGMAGFIQHCSRLERNADLQEQLQRLRELRARLATARNTMENDYAAAEKKWMAKHSADLGAITTYRLYEEGRSSWNQEFARLRDRLLPLRSEVQEIETRYNEIPLLSRAAANADYAQALAQSIAEAQACLKSLTLPARHENLMAQIRTAAGQEAQRSMVDEIAAVVQKASDDIQQWQTEQKAVTQELQETAAAFAALKDSLRHFDNRFQIYELGDAQLNSEDAIPDGDALKPALTAMKETIQKTEMSIHQHLLPDDALAAAAADLGSRLCQLALKGRGYRLADASLRAAPVSADGVANLISLAASRFDPLRKPSVPLTDMGEGQFQSQYHPEAAAAVYKDWQALGSLLQDPAAAFLDPEALKQLFAARDKAYKEYAERLVGYWMETVPREMKVRAFSWDEAHTELGRLNAATVNQSLEALCRLISRLFSGGDALGAYFPQEKVQLLRESASLALKRLENATFKGSCQGILKNWSDLPREAVPARDLVLESTPSDFSAKHLVLNEGAVDDYAVQYWSDLTYMLLRALADQSRANALGVLKGAGSHELDLIAKVQTHFSGQDQPVLGQGAKLNVPRLDEQIQRMRLLDLLYELARNYLRKTVGTVAEVEDLVAGRAALSKAIERPEIPLTATKKGFFDAKYHPVAAASFLADWKLMGRILNDKAIADAGRAELLRMYQGRQRTLDDYGKRFVSYWDLALGEDVQVRDAAWWPFRVALAEKNAGQVNAALRQLCSNIDAAFSAAGEMSGLIGSEALSFLRDKARQGEAWLVPNGQGDQGEVAWKNWNSLSRESLAARDALLSLKPDAFLSAYYAEGIKGRTGPEGVFWSSFTLGLLRSLAGQVQIDVQSSVQQFQRYVKFPLDQLRQESPDLSSGEVCKAGEMFGRIKPGGGTTGGNILRDGATTGDKALDQQLQALREVGLPAALENWLTQIQPVLAALPNIAGQTLSCRIWLLNEGEQKRLTEELGGLLERDSIVSIWRIVSLQQGSSAANRSKTLLRDNQLLGTVRYPGEKMDFTFFKYPSDSAPDWVLSFAGPWAPLRMLHEYGAKRDAADPRKWNVGVRTTDRAGGRSRTFWVQMEFDRVLPELKEWPAYEQPR
ncbi:MAG: type VI secretion protein IcmF/TssM N-terminal domain-containing protein [Lentisphaerota bacterium]